MCAHRQTDRHTHISCCSVTQLCPTLCDSMDCSNPLRYCGLQHARLPCPSRSPQVCPSSCLLNHWCHPTISFSVTLFSAFSLYQHQGLSQWDGCLHQVAKVLELQLQHPSFQWIFRTDFLLDWLVASPCCLGDSQDSSRVCVCVCVCVYIYMYIYTHIYIYYMYIYYIYILYIYV